MIFLNNGSSKHIPIMAIIGSACSNPTSIKRLLKKKLQKLVLMPTTYLSEKGFSCLVEPKTKKKNALKFVDSSMRMALERLIYP